MPNTTRCRYFAISASSGGTSVVTAFSPSIVHFSPTAACAAPSRSMMASGYSVKNGSRAMTPPPGISACTRAASSVVFVHIDSGLKVFDTCGNAGLKNPNSRPRRRAWDAARISSSTSPFGSITTTVPGARMASHTTTSSSRVLPLRVVPPNRTCPTSSLNGSTSGFSSAMPTACSAG